MAWLVQSECVPQPTQVRYRALAGLHAPSQAIYEGEAGCSLHGMKLEVDADPVAYAASFDVDVHHTGLLLSMKCVRSRPASGSRCQSAATSDQLSTRCSP
jgi:hypothetical protein